MKINSTSGLADISLSDFHQNGRVIYHISRDSYFGGRFGEDLWRIAVCKAFNSFRVTNTFYNLSNAADALGR